MRASLPFIFLLATSTAWATPKRLRYPHSPCRPVVQRHFGVAVRDDDRCLEVATQPAVARWVASENELAVSYLSVLPGTATIADELDRAEGPDRSAPKEAGGRWYFTVDDPVDGRPALCVRDREDGPDRTLLAPAQEGDADDVLGDWYPAPDGRMIAAAIHPANGVSGRLLVLDGKTGQVQGNPIPWADYADLSWAADGRGFYHTSVPANETSEGRRIAQSAVAYYSLDDRTDRPVFPPSGSPSTYLTPVLSPDGRWLYVKIWFGWTGAEIDRADLSASATTFVRLFTSTGAVATPIADRANLYLLTNAGAPYFRVLRAPLENGSTDFTEIVPERAGVTIESLDVARGVLLLRCVEGGASRLEIRSTDGALLHIADLPGEGTLTDLSSDADDADFYTSFESFAEPGMPLKGSAVTGAVRSWPDAPTADTTPPFTTERVSYTSADGTEVPMFVVSRRRDAGPRPTLLLVYGGFGVSMTPHFSPIAYALLRHGMNVAVPQLRGGGEKGEAWHRAATGRHKQRTIDDALAAARALVAKGRSPKGKVAVRGASNGGLTASAMIVQDPSLFCAASIGVPVTDLVRFPLSGEGASWTGEYGSPDDRGDFPFLLRLSPYHNVKSARYPAVLINSVDKDERVDPFHARKFAAALQRHTLSAAPVLLRTRSHAGHHGSGVRDDDNARDAEASAFILHACTERFEPTDPDLP